MALSADKFTVTSTAQKITGSGPYPGPIAISVPAGGNTVYLGGPDVTVAEGYPLLASEKFLGDVFGQDVWAITATTQDVNVLRIV